MESFNLMTDKWFILVNTAEENRAAQEWLFSNGAVWCNGDKKVDKRITSKCLTNYHSAHAGQSDMGINTEGFMHSDNGEDYIKQGEFELKLKFKVHVDSATYPIVESEQMKQIKALESTISMAQEQIKKLQEGMQ